MIVYSLMHDKITNMFHIQYFLLQIDGEFSYMIDIGVPGLDSLQIQIRKGPSPEPLATADVPELLNCDLPFSFWISWSGNLLQVGFNKKISYT